MLSYKWDDEKRLTNGSFSFLRVAILWFTNNQEKLVDWDRLCPRLRDMFVTEILRMGDATNKIFFWAHNVDNDYRSYFIDVLVVCKRAGQAMVESQMRKHITRDLREDSFPLTALKSASSVAGLVHI